MASFDQSVPQIAPDPLSYVRLAKGIETPKPDTSTATLIKGVTEATETGIKGVDEALEKHATFLGERLGDQERDSYLSNVTFAANQTLGNDSGKPQTPSEIENGLNFLQRNKDAYDQGKLRETEYLRNLYEKTKALRSQWPSYRDYIDKGVEKATGITPNANRLIESMLADINSRKSKDDEVTKQILRDAITLGNNGAPGMVDNVDAYLRGAIDRIQLLRKSNAVNRLKFSAEQTRDNMTIYDAGKTIDSDKAVAHIGQDFSEGYSHVLDGLMTNINGGEVNVDKVVADAMEGKTSLSQDQWAAIGRLENQRYAAYRAQKEAEYRKIPVGGGRSVAQMADAKFKAAMDAASVAHERFQDKVVNKDLGGLTVDKVYNESQYESNTRTILDDPNYGPISRVLKSVEKTAGPQAAAGIWARLSPMYGGPFEDKKKLALLSLKLMSGERYTAEDAASAYTKSAVGGKVDPDGLRALLKDLPVSSILGKDIADPGKRSIALSYFGPGNDNYLSRVPSSTTVGDKQVQGRQDVYLAYSQMAKEIKRISEGHPNIWEHYRNFMELQFSHAVFGDDVKALSQIEKDPNITLSYKDGDPPKFVMERVHKGGITGTRTPVPVTGQEERYMQNANKGLEGLYNVFKEAGEAPETVKARILTTLRSNDVNPNVGNSVARAMSIAVGSNKKPKDESKAKQNE